MVFSRELLMDTFGFVLDKRHYPVLVWDSTQAFVGAFRRAQKWSFSSVLSEYRAYSGEKPHYMVELFLELLDVEFMEHEEAVIRRQSVEGMEAAAAAAALTVKETVETRKPSESMYSNMIARPKDSNHVVVILPSLENLPNWFIRHRNRDLRRFNQNLSHS